MINVVIPSFKRADNLIGKDYFYMAKYVVPESQADDYIKTLGKDRVIICPDNEDGSIGKKRNWILKNIQRPLIMIDDDVKNLHLYENKKEFKSGRKLDKEKLIDFFEYLLEMAEGLDCKMFGLLPLQDPGAYFEYKPFSLTNMVLGPFTGHRDHELLYDEEMGSKDDYDMCLQQLNKYKKVLRYNKVCYKDAEDKKSSGGIVSYRTQEKEIMWCNKIMKKWGTKIIKYNIPPKKPTDLLNANKFEPPIKGV
jgi:hypothetical protein